MGNSGDSFERYKPQAKEPDYWGAVSEALNVSVKGRDHHDDDKYSYRGLTKDESSRPHVHSSGGVDSYRGIQEKNESSRPHVHKDPSSGDKESRPEKNSEKQHESRPHVHPSDKEFHVPEAAKEIAEHVAAHVLLPEAASLTLSLLHTSETTDKDTINHFPPNRTSTEPSSSNQKAP